MRYPVIAQHDAEQLAQQLIDGYEPSVEAAVSWAGDDDSEVLLAPIVECAESILSELERLPYDGDKDRFEGKASLQLHDSLAHLPFEVLDDRGFWRYLTLAYFWDFVAWREADPFAKGNYAKYVNAHSSTESVLPRMYLRAHALDGTSQRELAGAIPNATDFWRSHILRVQTGSAPTVSAAFARLQASERLATDPVRQLARAVNRTWTNVVLHLYSEDEAADLVRELRTGTLPDGGDGAE